MSRLKALLFSLLSLVPLEAQAAPREGEVAAFFDLVAIGSVQEVAEALAKTPGLATAPDKYGFQPIHVLDDAAFDAKLDLLLAHGADINAKTDEGITLLHVVIDPEFIPALIRRGADVGARDNRGRTPLMVHLTEPDGIEYLGPLLDAGSDPNAADNYGVTTLEYLREHGDPDAEALLIKAGAMP